MRQNARNDFKNYQFNFKITLKIYCILLLFSFVIFGFPSAETQARKSEVFHSNAFPTHSYVTFFKNACSYFTKTIWVFCRVSQIFLLVFTIFVHLRLVTQEHCMISNYSQNWNLDKLNYLFRWRCRLKK